MFVTYDYIEGAREWYAEELYELRKNYEIIVFNQVFMVPGTINIMED